ncbi:MAG: formylglycine-generating enzyme family protein [Kiritimatiellae bacterium]|nr:formylglycine-generating enzyme family protein [Kiritimatiellia bacterium]
MVLIAGGWLPRNFSKGDVNLKPRKFWIDSFYMDKYLVTQQHFQMIMGTNPSRWQQDNNPVERITWVGAAKYCNKRSLMEGLQPAYKEATWECNFEANGYRLPTEAEWEYAACGGKDMFYFFGNDPKRLRFFAWIKENSGGRTRPVGQKLPNPFGLYDIYGNVWEWCNDFYLENYYQDAPEKNPTGPKTGKDKVVRGGCWDSNPEECTSFFRGKAEPAYTDICIAAYDIYGFRIVRKAK